MRRALCLLLSLCLLLPLPGCGGREEGSAAVSLWCAADDPLLPALREAAETYSRSRKSGVLPVAIREFEDASALTNALNTARPDLLLCSHTLAFSLARRGLLTAAESVPVTYPEEIRERAEGVGRSLFPLGSRVQLLVSREAVPADVPALCARAAASGAETRLPFLAVDSFADLLCQAVLGSGEFHADRERDCFNAAFREGWNALAEAAFAGGLYAGKTPAAELLESGQVSAAILYSDRLDAALRERCTVVPAAAEGAPLLGDLCCLAVMAREGRQQHGTDAFLRWLFAGSRAASLALAAGLIPALPGGEGTDDRAALLLSLRERPIWLADGESDYIKNRAAFEEDFRAVLDLLK